MVSGYLVIMNGLNRWGCAGLETKVPNKNEEETAKLMFRLWKLEAKIENAPKVRGIDDKEFYFDFVVNNTHVDVFKPTPRSSAGFIRKSVECSDDEGKRLRTFGALDDRKEREKALNEMKVISRITQTMLYTDFVVNAEKCED